MFDAKSILKALVKGAAPQQNAQQHGGGLGDILGELGKAMARPGAAGTQAAAPGGGGLADILRQLVPQEGRAHGNSAAAGQDGLSGGLGDILKNMLPGGQQGPASAGAEPSQGREAGPAVPGSGSGGLGDILGKLQEQLGQAGKGAQGAGGGLMDILGQVLAQATEGVKEGAQRVDQATGASGHARDVLGKATGQTPEDLFKRLKDLISENQLAAGAAAGGLGAVVLGTKAGRTIATSALKMGGLALIGGLAYKALQNYQQGKPVVTGGQQVSLAAAPDGTGFETGAVSNDAAILYIRGMIAAAAADGRIDATEQEKVLGGLKQAGLGQHAEEFLAAELNQPAMIEDLVRGVSSEQEAVQLFTAARIAIDLDTQEEHDFLVGLAQGLGLDGKLVAHIDAMARSAA